MRRGIERKPILSKYLFIYILSLLSVGAFVSCSISNDKGFFIETISGRIATPSGSGLAGAAVTIQMYSGTSTMNTDANGNYHADFNSFYFMQGDVIAVTPGLKGYMFSPSSRTITFGDSLTGQDFTATRVYSISGKVTTNDGTAVGGVIITATSGTYSSSNNTDLNGNYVVNNLLNGTYTVTPSCSGAVCTFTPDSITVGIANANVTGQDIIINETALPVTNDATGITDTSAYLNGSFANVFGAATQEWFEYGTTQSYGNKTNVSYSPYVNVAGLQQLTTYHYRIVASNSGLTFAGKDKTFTTLITPETVASGLDRPTSLALDASTVYVSEPGAIKKVDKNGGTLTTLASGLDVARSVAVDGTSVYWVEYYGYTIKKIGINGGNVTTLASGIGNPDSLAIDDNNVYFTGTWIMKVNKNGVVVTTLATDRGTGIAVDSNNVYWTIDGPGGKIRKIGLAGGTAMDLAPADSASCVVSDSLNVYFQDAGNIKKIAATGGSAAALTSGPDMANNIVVDATDVYWIGYENVAGVLDIVSLRKVSKNGGPVTRLAAGLSTSGNFGLAVDDTHVYWTEGGSGSAYGGGLVRRVPKSY